MKSRNKALEKADKNRQKATEMARLLDAHYGVQRREKTLKTDPLEILILTILSQNTNDLNRDRAMAALQDRFPTWDKVAGSDAENIEKAIRVGGLARQKSRRIKDVLKWVRSTFGEYSLKGLDDIPTSEARDMLMSLKGVGPKTAAIVLLFGLGRPLFPVDTHVHRVTTRWGLLSEKTTAEAAHDILGGLFPEKAYYSAHLNIIRHGKEVCRARKPLCGSCLLKRECPWPGDNAGKYV